MIGKVVRGRNAARLLYYLYGPGKANEHTDPHLVTGSSDGKPVWHCSVRAAPGSENGMNANSALGAGGRRFESGHPDHKRRSQRLPEAKVASVLSLGAPGRMLKITSLVHS